MRRWWFTLVLGFTTACGGFSDMSRDAGVSVGPEDAGDSGVDAGATTSFDAGSISRFWDGGACTPAEACPCFSSDDCAPTHVCHSRDATGTHVYCEVGSRGEGVLGSPCSTEASCQSALCVQGRDGASFCSALCEAATACTAVLPKCTYIGFGVDRSICSP